MMMLREMDDEMTISHTCVLYAPLSTTIEARMGQEAIDKEILVTGQGN